MYMYVSIIQLSYVCLCILVLQEYCVLAENRIPFKKLIRCVRETAQLFACYEFNFICIFTDSSIEYSSIEKR